MSDDVRGRLAALPTGSAAEFVQAGYALLDADQPEALLRPARDAACRFPRDPRIHQFRGLVARTLGLGREAADAFAAAEALAPQDRLIAHSRARTAMEAGYPAVALFDRALALAPTDGSVLLGRAAAQVAEGRAEQAIADLLDILSRNPRWLEGHRSLSQILGQQGLRPLRGIDAALAAHPRQLELHRERIAILLRARDPAGAHAAADEALAVLGTPAALMPLAAHAASEAGMLAEAERLFAATPPAGTVEELSLRARHLIRAGRPGAVVALLDGAIERDRDHLLMPYAALAWRLTGDPRSDWLEGEAALVGVADVGLSPDELAGLAGLLRTLHRARAVPLDQSVSGGTQTDGNLLVRAEPAIERLRALILERVAEHVAALPPPRAGHPLLVERRTPQRIAGSWSVRLTDSGFHHDHVHSQGWISSALYVCVPGADAAGDPHAGWLALGEERDLVPGLPPVRLIEPVPGRLVLFPSTMWHGTRPFSAGERMTVAFDIARPRQG